MQGASVEIRLSGDLEVRASAERHIGANVPISRQARRGGGTGVDCNPRPPNARQFCTFAGEP